MSPTPATIGRAAQPRFQMYWPGPGRKTVDVYGFAPSPIPPDWEQGPEVAATLRRIYQTAWSALPDNAPLMRPTEVVVQTHEMHEVGAREVLAGIEPWPRDLTGHLTGERAQEAVRRRGLDPRADRWFLVEGVVHDVTCAPSFHYSICLPMAPASRFRRAIRPPRRSTSLAIPIDSTALHRTPS